MYSRDSFFDLSPWGQFGLACLSAVLFLSVCFAAWLLFRKRSVWIRIPGALTLFWLFVWLSPQAYYQYYILIIEDLPLQWVIKPPPNPIDVLQLMFFQGPHNLSAHGKALLGWSLIAVPFIRFSRRHRGAGNG